MKHLPLAHDDGSSFGVHLGDEAKLQPITVWVGIQVSGLNPATSTPLKDAVILLSPLTISSDLHCTTSGAEDSINAETRSRPIDQEAPGQSLDTPLKNRVIHSDLFSRLPPVNCIHNKMHCRKWERRMRWREKQSPFSMNILALGGILSVVPIEVREGEKAC